MKHKWTITWGDFPGELECEICGEHACCHCDPLDEPRITEFLKKTYDRNDCPEVDPKEDDTNLLEDDYDGGDGDDGDGFDSLIYEAEDFEENEEE